MTGRHCVCWTRVNLRPASRNISELNASWVRYFIQRVVCAESTCGAYVPVMSLCCIQVRAPARATVTRITAAAPRSVRWSEDWSSAPVTLDTDWWTMAKPARVLLCLCFSVCESLCAPWSDTTVCVYTEWAGLVSIFMTPAELDDWSLVSTCGKLTWLRESDIIIKLFYLCYL